MCFAFLGTLGLQCGTRGSISSPLGVRVANFSLSGALGLNFVTPGLHFGTLESHFGVFFRLWGRTLDPFSTFLENARKRCKKGQKKRAGMDAFPVKFLVFSENGKVCFDCAGASGLRFMPPFVSLYALIFALHFLLFLRRFCTPPGAGSTGPAAEMGAPLNEFN